MSAYVALTDLRQTYEVKKSDLFSCFWTAVYLLGAGKNRQ